MTATPELPNLMKERLAQIMNKDQPLTNDEVSELFTNSSTPEAEPQSEMEELKQTMLEMQQQIQEMHETVNAIGETVGRLFFVVSQTNPDL
jgi:hypothetical protein